MSWEDILKDATNIFIGIFERYEGTLGEELIWNALRQDKSKIEIEKIVKDFVIHKFNETDKLAFGDNFENGIDWEKFHKETTHLWIDYWLED